MPTTKSAGAKSAAKKSASSTKGRSAPNRASATNAIRLLTSDHREVKALFQQYEELVDHEAEDDEKQAMAQKICAMLTVHAQVEEEIFYPAAKECIREADLVDEATVEHASAKDLIAQLEGSAPSEELFDAKVKVLSEYIDHHVKEEEGELFPQARRAKLNMEELGRQIAERKSELMSELGMTVADGEPA